MSLRPIALDFETYYDSDFSLSKMTTREYILDTRFESIMVALRTLDGSPVCPKLSDKSELYAIGEVQIQYLITSIDWENVNAIAHNGSFDHAILAWRYGAHPAQLSCTLGMAMPFHASTVGGSLAKLATAYNLPDKGTAVHNMLGKRLADMDTTMRKEYLAYCQHDTYLCAELYKIFNAKIPPRELSVIDATLRMYTDPKLVVSPDVIEPHLAALEQEQDDALSGLIETLQNTGVLPAGVLGPLDLDGMRKHCASAPKFCALLEALGVEPPTKLNPKGVAIPALAKTDPGMEDLLAHEDPVIAQLAETRMSVKSTLPATRAKRFLDLSTLGGMPFPLKYYGAEQTGRWSAWDSINLQNLPRKSPLRDALEAPPGYTVVAGDLSQIELRTGLWLAGQEDKLDILRHGGDLYKTSVVDSLGVAYDDVTKEQRQMGKVTQLSAIFGTSAPTVRRVLWLMGRVRVDEATAAKLVETYRSTHPHVVAAWKQGDMALQMLSQGREGDLWGGKCRVTTEGILKPSGLYVRYPNLRQVVGDRGRPEWVYDKKLGRTLVATKIYGAKVYQNCVQSIARDIFATILTRVNKVRLYPPFLQPVGLIHDELIGITPTDCTDAAASLLYKALTTPVAFAKDIPLACEVETGQAYGLCKEWHA
jgi:hypothetical protein